MTLGRLGVWYADRQVERGSQLVDFVGVVRKIRLCSTVVSRIARLRIDVAGRLPAVEKARGSPSASSIANIYARDSFTARRAMVSLNDLYQQRFILAWASATFNGGGPARPSLRQAAVGHADLSRTAFTRICRQVKRRP